MSFIKKESGIDQIGVFVEKDYSPGETIGIYVTSDINSELRCRYLSDVNMDKTWYETKILGRWVNHSETPNTTVVMNPNEIILKSKGISKDEEITVNYWPVGRFLKFPKEKLGIYKKGLRES